MGYKPTAEDAEGASLDLAKPDETLRQKDPIPTNSGKPRKGTDGVNPIWDNLSGPITEAHGYYPCAFLIRQNHLPKEKQT